MNTVMAKLQIFTDMVTTVIRTNLIVKMRNAKWSYSSTLQCSV